MVAPLPALAPPLPIVRSTNPNLNNCPQKATENPRMLLLAAQPFGLPSPAAKALSPPAECSPFCTEKAEIFGGDKDAPLGLGGPVWAAYSAS